MAGTNSCTARPAHKVKWLIPKTIKNWHVTMRFIQQVTHTRLERDREGEGERETEVFRALCEVSCDIPQGITSEPMVNTGGPLRTYIHPIIITYTHMHYYTLTLCIHCIHTYTHTLMHNVYTQCQVSKQTIVNSIQLLKIN